MEEIIVSYIVTVYNKEPYVGHTVRSLLQQEGGIRSEYIFVDDVSSDRSLDVISAVTQGVPDVTIIRNSQNMGPSVRVNQGAKLARGRYLQFIDSDDIMAANATHVMLKLIERHEADVVHGGWQKTNIKSADLIGRRMPQDASYKVSDAPLEFVFKERIRRMSQMVRRDSFAVAGGCDERVFIQDESLGLRLARVAKRFLLLHAPVIFIPQLEGELSRNVSQLNHDRFLASYDMLQDFPALDPMARKRLYRRCVSAFWKQHRQMEGALGAAFTPVFLQYLRSKWSLPPVDPQSLESMNDFFRHMQGVLRVPSSQT